LRHDRTTEHASKRITDGRLEFALEALNQPSMATHFCALASLVFQEIAADGNRLGRAS
jgi:hypothetical protein